MKKNIITVAMCLAAVPFFAQKLELNTDKDKFSYIIGVDIAQNIERQGLKDDVDVKILQQALKDKLDGKDLVISEEAMQEFMKKFSTEKRAEAEKKITELKEKNTAEGKKFLEANKKKKGVSTTASGLQYEILTKGKSKEVPKAEDIVKVKYEGKLLNGTVFDSTEKNNGGEAIEFPLNNVIKGWTEGVQLMTKGSKYRFFIPSDLAYGENGAGKEIEPNSTLIFDVELVDFKKPEPKVDNKQDSKISEN